MDNDTGRVPLAPGSQASPSAADASSPVGADPSRVCPTCGGESRFEGRCGACIMADFDDDYEDECYECGGEGFVWHCFSEYACLHPEDGCDECTFRCDVCNPRPRDSDRSGEAGETGTGSTEGESAGPQDIAQTTGAA